MRVFVAGAREAIGQQPVPGLLAAGHEVQGMTRTEANRAMLHELDAVPLVADAGAVMTTELRGASDAKAKRELAWRPDHPSRRQGPVAG